MREWTAAVESKGRFEADYRFLHRERRMAMVPRDVDADAGTDDSVRYRQSFIEDITAERFAEVVAERSEARYRALVERLPVVVYVDSDEPEPRSLYVSPNSREHVGV